jgi:amino acid transporter
MLLILTLINVRGVKDTGTAFLIPTYLFVCTLLLVIVVGAVRAFAAGGHPVPIIEPHTCRSARQCCPCGFLLRSSPADALP